MQRMDDQIDFKSLKGFNLRRAKFVGGLARVYRAKYQEEPCAVKAFDIFDYKKFLNECRILKELSQLNSPYIVRYHGLVREPIFAVVLEWLPQSLNHYVYSVSPITDLRKTTIMLDVAYGICVMHDVGILHRDIKTANILLTSEYQAKLCDFNLSIAIESLRDDDLVPGTLRMMSPEILQYGKFSKASDVYAFGLTLWEVKRRRVPFEEIELEEDMICAKLLAQKEIIPANWSPGIKKIVSGCQEEVPESRLSMKEAVEILETEVALLENSAKRRR